MKTDDFKEPKARKAAGMSSLSDDEQTAEYPIQRRRSGECLSEVRGIVEKLVKDFGRFKRLGINPNIQQIFYLHPSDLRFTHTSKNVLDDQVIGASGVSLMKMFRVFRLFRWT